MTKISNIKNSINERIEYLKYNTHIDDFKDELKNNDLTKKEIEIIVDCNLDELRFLERLLNQIESK